MKTEVDPKIIQRDETTKSMLEKSANMKQRKYSSNEGH